MSDQPAIAPATVKPRLGRGLSSLIGSPAPSAEAAHNRTYAPEPAPAHKASLALGPGGGTITHLPITDISLNPHQPRHVFDEGAIAELSASIAQQGILQPLLVAPALGADAARPYVLIAGERRLRAAQLAGLAAVPCIIRHATDRQLLEWSLIENIQRQDLNAIEKARAYRDYMDRFALTHAEVAERTGQSRANITNYLRVLDLSDAVQGMLLKGDLTFGHARALAGLAGKPDAQASLAARTVSACLSVRHLERLVAQSLDGQAAPAAAPAPAPRRHKASYVQDLEERLTQAIGTRVAIHPGRAKNSGRIVIEYYNLDDFDRISDRLGLKEEV